MRVGSPLESYTSVPCFGTRLLAGRWRAVQIWSTNRLNISLLGNALYYALTNHEMTPKCPCGDHLPPSQFTHLSLQFFLFFEMGSVSFSSPFFSGPCHLKWIQPWNESWVFFIWRTRTTLTFKCCFLLFFNDYLWMIWWDVCEFTIKNPNFRSSILNSHIRS